MPLYIAGETFSGEFTESLYQRMLQQIQRVPRPHLSNDYNIVDSDKDHKVSVLQGEYAYIDRLHPASSINTVLTKDVMSCIFAVLYNETDCLAIHVDDDEDIGLDEHLKRFNDPYHVKVKLLGGKSLTEQSRKNLKNICRALFEAARRSNIHITIDTVSINHDNAINNEDLPYLITDFLLTKANYLKRYLFHSPLDKKHVKHISPSLFYSKHSAMDTSHLAPFIALLYRRT